MFRHQKSSAPAAQGPASGHSSEREKLGSLMVLTTAVLWGIIGIFSRSLQAAGLSSVQITLIRSSVVTLSLFIFLVFNRSRSFRVPLSSLWIFAGAGILGNALQNIFYFNAIQMAGMMPAAVLLYTAPCFVVFLSAVFFKERVPGRKLAALILSFIGCILISGFSPAASHIAPDAFVIGILAGVCYALNTIFLRFATGKGIDPVVCTFYSALMTMVGLLPVSSLPAMAEVFAETPQAFFPALAISFISTLLPSILYNRALTLIEAGKASMISYVQPVISGLIGVFFFGESLSFQSLIGMILIACAMVMLVRRQKAGTEAPVLAD